MKKLKSFVFIFIVVLTLAACGTAPQEITLPSEMPAPETTVLPTVLITEDTEPSSEAVPTESAAPSVEPTILPEYHFSFFMYLTAPVQNYYNFYVAPAGTEEWYFVQRDHYTHTAPCYDQLHCVHPRTADGDPKDDVLIFRAYIEYDGPETTEWILRVEYPSEEEAAAMFSTVPNPFECQWDSVFELKNNQSLLALELVPNYTEISKEDYEMLFTPISRPMDFCEKCPEYWKIPVG